VDLSHYTFVALDLETTWLSPTKDTIIEVAAVKFQLERDGDIFRMVNAEERSMLIDPERDIDEHISMITGISNAMVRGKPKWREVKERVKDFIGEDSIIVGHNVLFDVAMLSTHGIDLKDHIILDTFELSELFSSEAESLNLGFLGKHLGIDMESEHRALDDTKLSVKLFLHYLSDIVKMEDSTRELWRYARRRDESKTIDTLLMLTGDEEDLTSYKDETLTYREIEILWVAKKQKKKTYEIVDLKWSWEREHEIIEKARKNGKVLIITSSKGQSEWLEKKLSESYRVARHIARVDFISLSMIATWLERPLWKRKETILILRLIDWVRTTETGSMSELKWYGEEQDYRELFICGEQEWHDFRERNKEEKSLADIVIASSYATDQETPILRENHTLIVHDIISLDSALRYRESFTISWPYLYDLLEKLKERLHESHEEISMMLETLEQIYSRVIERPKGREVSPPWEYGETYFYTPRDLWHHGEKWLVWASDRLEFALTSIKNKWWVTQIEKVYLANLSTQTGRLIALSRYRDENTGIILTIKEWETKITIIPRHMGDTIDRFLSLEWGESIILMGHGIDEPILGSFLREEYHIKLTKREERKEQNIAKISSEIQPSGKKIVYLATNLKHLRTFAQEIKNTSSGYEVYTQGISGGKGKMRTLFQKSEKAILIWLIDTWMDDGLFFEGVSDLVILKVPFDPPSDPYYLARTVGMTNNFESYSLPLALSKINTLIGHAHSANPTIAITLTDEKLISMSWWVKIQGQIL
jgi:DNA polymerase III epsilon subunit-like protein